jgi:hypothetical protein
MTLLPGAAAIKRREPDLSFSHVIEGVRDYSVNEISRVLDGLSLS